MTKKSAPTPEPKPDIVYLPDPAEQKPKLKQLGGSNADDFNNVLATSVIRSLWYGSSSQEETDRRMQAALATLISLKPQDEIEGMLIGQMIATNAAAMECYRRAMLSDQTFEGRQQNLNFAGKLTRTYALHLEALDKHRGKGQQTVRVEHVTVNAGGQAIVGNVTAGGGVTKDSEEQSHAKAISHAPEPQMRSPCENDRQALPVASNEER
jgi:hypothetical protein